MLLLSLTSETFNLEKEFGIKKVLSILRLSELTTNISSFKGQTFHQAATIESWLVLVFDTDRFFSVQEAQNAVMGLVGACGLVGKCNFELSYRIEN